MAKIVKYDVEAKEKILNGVVALEKAVASTLGPGGRNVIIDEHGLIHSTKDGVTVAKAFDLKDRFENLGANAIREVAEKSASNCGDGTTTSTVLAATIYKNGLKYVSLGSNATQIKNGVKKASAKVVEYIKSISQNVATREDLKRVATVSANGDEEIGSMISEVMDKIGNDGTIKVENGNGMEMTSKIVEGMVIDQSYISPYFITNPETMEVELENPFILVVNKKIANIQEFLPCLQFIAKTGRPLLVIADEYQEDIVGTLVMNRLRGAFMGAAIKAPSYGDNRKFILEDIALLCGGRVVSDATGTRLENAAGETGILGSAKKVVINRDSTVIMGGCGDENALKAHAEALRTQIKSTHDEFDREHLQERLAKLTSGIGVISVGATTDAERKELRDRVDDAFCASKAALRSGIVPGGGTALIMAKHHFDDWSKKGLIDGLVGDEGIGATILLDSLEAPIKKILENAGIDSSLIVAKMLDTDAKPRVGYNVLKKEFVDMVQDGVVDPTEVVINEVQNAASIASLLLTTECLIVEEPQDCMK